MFIEVAVSELYRKFPVATLISETSSALGAMPTYVGVPESPRAGVDVTPTLRPRSSEQNVAAWLLGLVAVVCSHPALVAAHAALAWAYANDVVGPVASVG
jgi:hypothetical protein